MPDVQLPRVPPAPGTSVCAVVVTYNRAALLRECLDAVLGQTTAVEVVVIDNASTDDTPAVLAEYADRVRVVRLPENTGGAGGFHRGIELGLETGADWFWLMDDDTIARPDCVERLLAASARADGRADVLASKVEWLDGRRHPMNAGKVDVRFDRAESAAAAACIAIRSASFVSIMVSRRAVLTHGLPMSDYFIWVDDSEYTMRITRDGLGLLVPDSVAVHKTQYYEIETLTPRYYYHVRNWLWLYRFSPAIEDGRRGPVLRHLLETVRGIRRTPDREVRAAALRGLRDGVLRRPDLTPLRPLAGPAASAQRSEVSA